MTTTHHREYLPDQRWVAHPNQDVVYGFGFGAVDEDPVVLSVPNFGGTGLVIRRI